MTDLLTVAHALRWPLIVAAVLVTACWLIDRALYALAAEDEWAALTHTVDQARADIDAIPDVIAARRLVTHPSGLVLITTAHIDITDLQRAETPADLWRDA